MAQKNQSIDGGEIPGLIVLTKFCITKVIKLKQKLKNIFDIFVGISTDLLIGSVVFRGLKGVSLPRMSAE